MASVSLPLFLPLLFLLFSSLNSLHPKPLPSSPYLSPTTIFPDYQNMLSSFRIFIYNKPNNPFTFTTQPFSLFQTSLADSPFITHNPEEAHLFFIPFSPDLSTRSLARFIRDLRISLPYWNRTLGADHFFISPAGVDYSHDRSVLELKKNSVQISLFLATSGVFIPHKDIALPPFNPSPLELPRTNGNSTPPVLGYMKWDGKADPALAKKLASDPDFIVEYEQSDDAGRAAAGSSKFCLFAYGGDVERMGEAMAAGCVPVVIVDRPVQDLPLMDVLRWAEIAVLVRRQGGAEGLKAALVGIGEEKYERMRELGVMASKHLVWNSPPQPHDAFHMVMYQLWLRRHTIRYARRE